MLCRQLRDLSGFIAAHVAAAHAAGDKRTDDQIGDQVLRDHGFGSITIIRQLAELRHRTLALQKRLVSSARASRATK